jgi:hypothetical protein
MAEDCMTTVGSAVMRREAAQSPVTGVVFLTGFGVGYTKLVSIRPSIWL